MCSPHDDIPGGGAESYRPGYELAAERILEFIAEQGLGPGARLPTEKELAVLVGVSRPVARDAIRTIAALGRVTVRRGAGIFVAERGPASLTGSAFEHFLPGDIDQVYSLFELRRTLERETSRMAAARATPRSLKTIRAAVVQGLDAAAANDFGNFRLADEQFHVGVAQAGANVFFVEAIQSIVQLRRQVITIGLSNMGSGSLQRAAEQHAEVAAAIEDGDPEVAADAMSLHIDVTLEQFKVAIQRKLFGDEVAGSRSRGAATAT